MVKSFGDQIYSMIIGKAFEERRGIMKKKLAVLLTAAMCLSAVPQSMHLNAAESTEPGISLMCAHSITDNRIEEQTRTYAKELPETDSQKKPTSGASQNLTKQEEAWNPREHTVIAANRRGCF